MQITNITTGTKINANGDVFFCYYKNGQPHKEDGPSAICTETKMGKFIAKYWYVDGNWIR